MKRKFNIMTAGVAVLMMAASCDLNLTEPGTLTYNPEKIIENATDLKGFEAGVMVAVRTLDSGDYDLVPDVMVDYFNACKDYGNNYGPVHRLDASFTTGDEDTEFSWLNSYAAILRFNIAIEGGRKVPAELQAGAAIMRGEAFLGRAMAYLHMARHFGPAYNEATAATDLCVPHVIKYDQSARPRRASVKVIYDQIKEDLDSAAVLLQGVAGAVRAQKPTIDAVNAMYARYYLDTKDYTNAAATAAALVDGGTYALSTNADAMENEWSKDNGTEAIMQMYGSLAEGGYGTHSIYVTSMANDDTHGKYITPYFIPCKKLVDSYESGDLRLAQWFTGAYAVRMSGNWYNDDHANPDFLTFSKYLGNPNLNVTAGIFVTRNMKKPFMIAEQYLIAAEAYLQSGDATNAAKYLQELQTKRGATASGATMENIQEEWYKEVVGEGLYFSCLKRWGIGFSGRAPQTGAANVVSTEGTHYTTKVLAADDYHFQWPVPLYEMQTNLNLKQNPGYSAIEAEPEEDE